MKKISNWIRNMGILKFFTLLFLVGFILGMICANGFKDFFLSDVSEFQTYLKSNLNTIEVNKSDLLRFVLLHKYKTFLVIIFICLTTLGVPFIISFIIFQGFKAGFVLMAAILQYGWKGILLFFSFSFPQCILYVPALFFTLVKGYYLCKNLHYNESVVKIGRGKRIIESIPVFLLLGIALLLGGILEAYVNSTLIKGILMKWF